MSKFNKILNYFSSEVIKKKIGQFSKNNRTFCPKALQNMVPGSGTNPFRIPDPGVKKAPDPGSGSGSGTLVDSDCFFLMHKCRYQGRS